MGQKSEHQLSANSPKSPPQEQHLLTHLSPPKLCSTQGSGRKGSNLYTLLRSSHPKPQEHHPTGSKSPAAPEMHRVRQRETKAPTDDMGKPQQCVSTPHPPQPSSSPGLPGDSRIPLARKAQTPSSHALGLLWTLQVAVPNGGTIGSPGSQNCSSVLSHALLVPAPSCPTSHWRLDRALCRDRARVKPGLEPCPFNLCPNGWP